MKIKKILAIILTVLLCVTTCFSITGCSYKTEPEIFIGQNETTQNSNTENETTKNETTKNETTKNEATKNEATKENPINFNCENCQLKYWGNNTTGGFTMLFGTELITCIWSPENEAQFTSICINCEKEYLKCICEKDILSKSIGSTSTVSEGTSYGSSFSSSSTLKECDECGLLDFECICSDKCKNAGCERYIEDCGCELTNHKCDPSKSYSHGHSQSITSSATEGENFASNSSASTNNSTNISWGTPVEKCSNCGESGAYCICSEECKKANCEIIEEECGVKTPSHHCEEYKNTSFSHGHSVSMNATPKEKTQYEKTEKGFKVFCFNNCKSHNIEL